MSIITSLLDTDLYKITMMQAMFHKLSYATGEYKFHCRTKGIDLLQFKDEIDEELDSLCEIQFNDDELDYLSKIRFIKPDFIDFLRIFKLNRKCIITREINGILDIRAIGPLYMVSPFEIYVLSIIHEVYSRNVNPFTSTLTTEGKVRLHNKIETLNAYKISEGVMPSVIDFGTRRRYSKNWHSYVISELVSNKTIIGTSNLMFAMLYNIIPIGTFAHEWVQLFQGLETCQLRYSQKNAFQTWADEYRGDLGIALSDTLGTDKFLKDFDMYFAKLFDGCRHDSGDPFEWGDKIIKHYDPVSGKAHGFSRGMKANHRTVIIY